MLKLFYSPGACSLASHVALEEAGAAFETQRVDLREGAQRGPDYLALNPKGKVPALATDKGVLTENPAILGYVARSFPEAGLAPDDSFAWSEVQAFNAFLASACTSPSITGSSPRAGRPIPEAPRRSGARPAPLSPNISP